MEKTALKSKSRKPKRMFSWMNPQLEVREIKNYGKGVFARKNINKNELLAIFGGHVMKASDEQKLSGNLSDYSLQISENFVIGPAEEKEIGDAEFFNHSCDPNAGFEGQITLAAMRNIRKGEQITFDYAMVLSKSSGRKHYKFNCLCGSPICRKIVKDNDWKILLLRKKYRGYFQRYLERKISKQKNEP